MVANAVVLKSDCQEIRLTAKDANPNIYLSIVWHFVYHMKTAADQPEPVQANRMQLHEHRIAFPSARKDNNATLTACVCQFRRLSITGIQREPAAGRICPRAGGAGAGGRQ